MHIASSELSNWKLNKCLVVVKEAFHINNLIFVEQSDLGFLTYFIPLGTLQGATQTQQNTCMNTV